MTCINFQLMKRIFLIEYDPTIEDTYLHELTVDGEVALLKILDTAGQEEFAEMRSSQVRERSPIERRFFGILLYRFSRSPITDDAAIIGRLQ